MGVDRGLEARESSGQDGYGTRKSKGWDLRILKRWEAQVIGGNLILQQGAKGRKPRKKGREIRYFDPCVPPH